VARRASAADSENGVIVASAPFTSPAESGVRLRVCITGGTIGFDAAGGDGQFQTLLDGADARMLASEASNQFTGVVIGPYAGRAP
jgi:xylan 1,4-beta-xylosidase